MGIHERKQERNKKKERKHSLDQEDDQEKKKKVFRLKNINKFYFQLLVELTKLNIYKR